jgi:hypothetical protein
MTVRRNKVSKSRRHRRRKRALHPAVQSFRGPLKRRSRSRMMNKRHRDRYHDKPAEESKSDSQGNSNSAGSFSSELLLTDKHIAEAYEEGYRRGCFDGGEAKVMKLIPPSTILPELTVDDLIGIGFQTVSSILCSLLSPAAIYDEMTTALNQTKSLSIVRLGDGELLTLAHDTIMPTAEVMRWGPFLPYAGVNLPNPIAREDLIQSLQQADIIGIPESRHPSYQALLFPILRYYGIDYRGLRMTSSIINYALNEEGYLAQLLVGRKILIIGNEAPGLSRLLEQQGFHISGIIYPVQGVTDVSRVMRQTTDIDFDLALVAAGIAAVLICTRIAKEQGKVSFDLGHLANKLESGEATLRSRL